MNVHSEQPDSPSRRRGCKVTSSNFNFETKKKYQRVKKMQIHRDQLHITVSYEDRHSTTVIFETVSLSARATVLEIWAGHCVLMFVALTILVNILTAPPK